MAEKTPNLFDVPKTHPSKADKLNAFKEQHGIWTYRVPIAKEDHPWEALLVPQARTAWTEPTMEPMDLIFNYCRVLEEQGLLVSGETEREAIRQLCVNNNIPCPF